MSMATPINKNLGFILDVDVVLSEFEIFSLIFES
jgi:hypothetical protein